jgi:hypothetical protein
MKRIGTDIWILAGLLILFAVMTTVIASYIPEAPETTPRRTTFSAKPGGLKAAYLLLQQSRVPVERLTVAPAVWPTKAGVVITATPYAAQGMVNIWSKDETKQVQRWVERGGVLLVMDNETDGLLEKFGLEVDTHLKSDVTLPPQQPTVFLRRVRGVRFPERERIKKHPQDAVSLFGDTRPAMVALRRGRGMIYVLATPAVFENRTLLQADNARFLVQLVQYIRRDGGKVYFNEYHQGYMQPESLWTIIGKPGQFAFYQFLLTAILISYSAARRFGLPRPMPPPSRVSSEYVTSLADLYRRAGARDAALDGVYQVFWRDLCRAAGVPPDTAKQEVIRRAAVLADGNAAQWEIRLTRLLGECEDKIAAGPKEISDAVLLRLTNDLEDLRKELQLGGHD